MAARERGGAPGAKEASPSGVSPSRSLPLTAPQNPKGFSVEKFPTECLKASSQAHMDSVGKILQRWWCPESGELYWEEELRELWESYGKRCGGKELCCCKRMAVERGW